MKIIIVSFLLNCIYLSCNYNSPVKKCDDLTFEELHKKNGTLSHWESDSTIYLFDYGKNGRMGVYNFYKNNQLREYIFFQDTINYSYSEMYKENGNLDTIIGSPFIWEAPEGNPAEKIKLKFKIFNLNKKIITCKIKINQIEFENFSFKNDSIFSNMQATQFLFNSNGATELNIYANCSLELCSGVIREFKDSILLRF